MVSIQQVMLFASEYGECLSPLTDIRPRPLLPLRNELCTLSIILERLQVLCPQKVVIGAHHLFPKFYDFVQAKAYNFSFELCLSFEEEFLGTGGSLLSALSFFDLEAPLLMLSAYIWWDERGRSYLSSFVEAFLKNKTADTLVSLSHRSLVCPQKKIGEYKYKQPTTPLISSSSENAEYLSSEISILKPHLFLDFCSTTSASALKPFSLKEFYDDNEVKKKIFGHVMSYPWIQVSTFASLERLRECL